MGGQEVSSKQLTFKNFVTGWPKESDFLLETSVKKLEVAPGSKDVIVKTLYLSCDPFMRGRMREDYTSYAQPYQPGKPISGFAVGRVSVSDDPSFQLNDLVTGFMPFEDYATLSGPHKSMLRKIDASIAPLSWNLGILGMTGFTAYVGLFNICAPKAGEKVLVSAAAGAVGQIVGQFAKSVGCYVVGSAGTQDKIDILKSKFGYDEAFNYKEEADLDATLKRFFPDGIDIYFDNVGGKLLDAALANMKPFGRISGCGCISQYNLEKPDPIYNTKYIVSRRIKFQGFIQSDHLSSHPDFIEMVGGMIKDKTVECVEDVAHGWENAVPALIGLFNGTNVGKQVVKVADE